MINIGDKAPEFKLYDSDRNEVSLTDYRGKNLLMLFYPAAFSSTCTEELCSYRDGLREFQSMDSEIVGISVDSIFTLGKFKEANQFQFPLLADFNKEVSMAYDCLYDSWILGMKGVAKRSAFIVDKNGTIRYAEVLEHAGDLPNFDAIKQTLAEL